MTVNEYQTRYETISKLELSAAERKEMLVGLLVDIERASKIILPENELLKQEVGKLNDLYREVFSYLVS